MFYTEYRPQKFNELIGAEHIIASITGTLAKKTPAHAYFFTGSRGTGKTTTARLLAKALNCQNPKITENLSVKFEPCGKCESCLAIQKGNHLDLIEIDAASNRGIDNIRELKEGVNLSPSMGNRKIYIIDEVHMLTTEASNALLKTLEEPPEHVFFILCTTNPEKVLDTIKSRCLQLQFRRPTIDDLVSKLNLIAKDKNQKVSEEDLKKIAMSARGAYRDAETLLEQFFSNEEQFDTSMYSDNRLDFIKYIFGNNTSEAINLVHKVYESGTSIETWTENLIGYLRSLMLLNIGIKLNGAEFTLSESDENFAKTILYTQIKNAIEKFTKATLEFKSAVIPTLPLEMAIVELTQSGEKLEPEIPIKTKIEAEPITEKKGENKTTDTKLDIKILKPFTKPEPKTTEEKMTKSTKTVQFSYKQLVEAVKPRNHAIHLILHSCELINFDGKYLDVRAYYSFHKERLLSMKIKEIIQEVASTLTGTNVVLRCELSNKNPDAKKLTDKNIVIPADAPSQSAVGKGALEDVFEKVFGEDIATSTE